MLADSIYEQEKDEIQATSQAVNFTQNGTTCSLNRPEGFRAVSGGRGCGA
jgi:hypothetical protein